MAIDRKALVKRHHPKVTKALLESPLSVGNGEFAFTADVTGLQSFTREYDDHFPLCTQSQWGWHSTPVSQEKKSYQVEDVAYKMYATYGRDIGYRTSAKGQEEAFDWVRQNPHRLNLGKIGFKILLSDGSAAKLEDIQEINQELSLWKGILKSQFAVEGAKVDVKTLVHPYKDLVAVRVESDLIAQQRISVSFAFPYGSPEKNASNWGAKERHTTHLTQKDASSAVLLRELDDTQYFVNLKHSKGLTFTKKEDHHYCLANEESQRNSFTFVIAFGASSRREELPSFEEAEKRCKKYWKNFWQQGGAVQIIKSKDERAFELERRIILSQYQTAIQCAGSLPPQETGLCCNSWYGKFHLEMHWWHAASFPLWGRVHLLEKSLWWYQKILKEAIKLAASQGYEGARWPKMVGPDGVDSPSKIGGLLIWQQPHPMVYAELCYKAHEEDPSILEVYKEIVFKTAEFMVSYAHYDEERKCYVLGAPLIPAQENHKPEVTLNPTFELEYWKYGLDLANEWKRRLGLPLNEKWKEVSANLAPLPVKDGVYLAHENCPDTFEKFNKDHPSMLGAYGILSGDKVDTKVMLKTLHKVLEVWEFDSSWGWDFPMMAMTAARLGEPHVAIDTLLMQAPKNTYRVNGHNGQVLRKDLPLYLPGNGGLLTAVGMMAAGWKGAPAVHAPGFPQDDSWTVEVEGIMQY